MQRRVLFVFSIYHYYREMLPVAEYYHRQGYQVHVLIGFRGATASEACDKCKAIHINVHWVPSELGYGDHLAADSQRGKDRSVNSRRSLLRSIGVFLSLLRKDMAIQRFADSLISSIVPDMVFGGPYHSCGEIDNGIAKVVRRRGVPYCCLPVSPYVGERQAVFARFNNLAVGMISPEIEANRSGVHRCLARFFPEWTRTRDNRQAFMFDPLAMAASRVTGLLPANPWQKPSEDYDVVFVESEFSRKLLLESKYDCERIIVAGKPLLDKIFDNLKDKTHGAEVRRKLDLDVDEPFILCNVEPSAEHRYSSWEDHWDRFARLMESLKATGWKIVLSLHPLCDPDKYKFVEQKYDFRLALDYKMAELYPHCSVAVSFPCSTNVLASVFNKPLVIYDFFGLTDQAAPQSGLYRLPGALFAYGTQELVDRLREALCGLQPGRGCTAEREDRSACKSIYWHVQQRFGV